MFVEGASTCGTAMKLIYADLIRRRTYNHSVEDCLRSMLTKRAGLATSWAALIILLVLANFLSADGGQAWVPHAIFHLSVAAIGALLFVTSFQPRPGTSHGTSSRAGPMVFRGGSVILALAQAVESISAWAERVEAGILHTSSGAAGLLGLSTLVVGGIVWVLTVSLHISLPGWTVALLLAISLVLIALFTFGLG